MIKYSLEMTDEKNIVEKLFINDCTFVTVHKKQPSGAVSIEGGEIHELAEDVGLYNEKVLDKIYDITDSFLAMDIFELDEMV